VRQLTREIGQSVWRAGRLCGLVAMGSGPYSGGEVAEAFAFVAEFAEGLFEPSLSFGGETDADLAAVARVEFPPHEVLFFRAQDELGNCALAELEALDELTEGGVSVTVAPGLGHQEQLVEPFGQAVLACNLLASPLEAPQRLAQSGCGLIFARCGSTAGHLHGILTLFVLRLAS
jgi:hypothetical protein